MTYTLFSDGAVTMLPAPPAYDYDALSAEVERSLLPSTTEEATIMRQPWELYGHSTEFDEPNQPNP
jgi:hypothetical protein